MKNNAKNWKVIEKFFKKDRWWVKLELDTGRTKKMPYANYVWMHHNPSFLELPRGYVIHRLDHDKLNDDISNLVIMQKHHHASHHWKSKKVYPDVKIDERSLRPERLGIFPDREPKVRYNKQRDVWCLKYTESGKRRSVSAFNGKRFETEEDAMKLKRQAWDRHQ